MPTHSSAVLIRCLDPNTCSSTLRVIWVAKPSPSETLRERQSRRRWRSLSVGRYEARRVADGARIRKPSGNKGERESLPAT
jgi:hypothetical protein